LITAAGAAALSAVPASAAVRACASTDVTPNSTGTVSVPTGCEGWYSGNLNSGNSTDLAAEAVAVNALLGTSFTASTLTYQDVSFVGNVIDLVPDLTGPFVLAIHVGAALGEDNNVGGEGTAFFRLTDFVPSVTVNVPGLSNARIFGGTPAVPEIGTWAMMLLGLGGIGWALRQGRKAVPGQTTLTYNGMARPA
jgi:hypothetical protein